MDELRRLCERDPARSAIYEWMLPRTEPLSDVPLVHGVPKAEDFVSIVKDEELRSRPGRGLPSRNKAEQFLGIHDKVYTSAGHLYPDAEIALVFRPEVEDETVDASPWDTGTFVNRLCKDRSDDERRAIFIRYSLPAPGYRSYLVHYTSACFTHPQHYLRGVRNGYPDPVGAMADHLRSRCFEVRFTSRLPVDRHSLLGVFYRRSALSSLRGLGGWLQELKQNKVDVRSFDNYHYLSQGVRDWILDHLGGLNGGDGLA